MLKHFMTLQTLIMSYIPVIVGIFAGIMAGHGNPTLASILVVVAMVLQNILINEGTD